MSSFLDTLKERLADTATRLQASTGEYKTAQAEYQAVAQKFQVIQHRFQALTAEHQSWAKAVEVETRREAAERAAQEAGQRPFEFTVQAVGTAKGPSNAVGVSAPSEPPKSEHAEHGDHASSVNKTDLVRDQLRQHPTGLLPVEVWRAVKEQIPNRGYVYSVLSRLKDRDQVSIRRGKYYLRVPPPKLETDNGEEEGNQGDSIQ